MTELEKIEELRNEFLAAEDPDLEYFRNKMKAEMASRDQAGKERLIEAFKKSAEDACDHAEKVYNYVSLKMRLEKALNVISMSYMAEHYFNKSGSWFSQRLHNHKVNGAPVAFTDGELSILSNALDEMGQLLKDTARSIA